MEIEVRATGAVILRLLVNDRGKQVHAGQTIVVLGKAEG